ncbi:MAG TPA: bidirectional hydrogenase complex protein HoxU [Acidobacteriota bacterium]|nr:bidirectional hydrogenase complex protein HoxU [Acidobacteriota bacterium]
MSTAPARVKTLIIDDRHVSGREEETILDVARQNGINIPTLCQVPGLSAVGSCRLCLVEIKGSPKLFPACVTLVREGMEVVTRSERLDNYRKMILELMFSEGNHICAVCVSNGNCELQSLAQSLGIDSIRFPYRFPKLSVDASHERFVVDHNRCILCARCVRACGEIEGAHTWDVMGRGVNARIISDMDEPWGNSDTCTSCGKCVQLCPTGALVEKGKSVAEMSKKKGFLPYIVSMREGRQ